MKINADLLDALQMTEVRNVEEYEAMTLRRATASDRGSLLYRPREPGRAQASDGQALSKIGDTRIGGLQFSYVIDRFGMEITFPELHPLGVCVMVVLEGAVHYAPLGSEVAITSTAGRMLLCNALPGARALTTDGAERLNLWVNAKALVRCLEAMLGQALDAPLAFGPEKNWPRGVAGTLRRLVQYAAEELADPYSSFAGGIGAPGFEDLVIRTIVEGAIHNYTERLARAPSAAPPQAVRRARAFMLENLFQPITVEDVAQSAGCSARALAAAFRSQHGRTVTSVLRDLRLDAAREAFAAGNPAVRVGELATHLGFSNPGRFTRFYVNRFGETPLRTKNARSLAGPFVSRSFQSSKFPRPGGVPSQTEA